MNVDYSTFRRLSIVTVFGLAAIMIAFFRTVLFPILQGLVILWIGIGLALVSNIGAFVLTKRAVAMQGVGVEDNPDAKEMFAKQKFTPLYASFAFIVGVGVLLSAVSLITGILPVGLLIVVMSIAIWFWLDLLNDAYQMSKVKQRN